MPPGVQVEIPLQAYFRINTENMGQFERTLIIADEGSYVHYVEGCTAPIYQSDSLHSAVVEIIVKKDARCRYTTIQNWSNNVYNLVTKRATCEAGATMEWIDGNIGSKVTMKYPAVYLMGEHAQGETLSVAFAGEGQHQDAGAKMVHAAPHTSSIDRQQVGRARRRPDVVPRSGAGARGRAPLEESTVRCDALLVDTMSRSDTYPYVDVREDDVAMGHEATVSKVSDDQLFYLMSRGMTEDEAMAMIVRGFIEPIARELPMEYALELNRLIELQMEGAVGCHGGSQAVPAVLTGKGTGASIPRGAGCGAAPMARERRVGSLSDVAADFGPQRSRGGVAVHAARRLKGCTPMRPAARRPRSRWTRLRGRPGGDGAARSCRSASRQDRPPWPSPRAPASPSLRIPVVRSRATSRRPTQVTCAVKVRRMGTCRCEAVRPRPWS